MAFTVLRGGGAYEVWLIYRTAQQRIAADVPTLAQAKEIARAAFITQRPMKVEVSSTRHGVWLSAYGLHGRGMTWH